MDRLARYKSIQPVEHYDHVIDPTLDLTDPANIEGKLTAKERIFSNHRGTVHARKCGIPVSLKIKSLYHPLPEAEGADIEKFLIDGVSMGELARIVRYTGERFNCGTISKDAIRMYYDRAGVSLEDGETRLFLPQQREDQRVEFPTKGGYETIKGVICETPQLYTLFIEYCRPAAKGLLTPEPTRHPSNTVDLYPNDC